MGYNSIAIADNMGLSSFV